MTVEARLTLPELKSGATYSETIAITSSSGAAFNLTPWSASGFSVRAKFRKESYEGDSIGTVTAAISGSPTAGLVAITIASDVTINAQGCRFLVYEVEGVNGNVTPNVITPFVGGRVRVNQDLT